MTANDDDDKHENWGEFVSPFFDLKEYKSSKEKSVSIEFNGIDMTIGSGTPLYG